MYSLNERTRTWIAMGKVKPSRKKWEIKAKNFPQEYNFENDK